MFVEVYFVMVVVTIVFLTFFLYFTGNTSINTFGKKAETPVLKLEELSASAIDPKSIPKGIKYACVEELWKHGFKGQNVKVGIIDSGVWDKHGEFGKTKIHDRNGIPDDFNGTNIHGTHVGGTVAANGVKIIGSSPECIIYDYRIFANDNSRGKAARMSGDVGVLITAIDRAIADGCHVINMSLGIPHDYSPIRNAIHKAHKAGVTIVAAAGNREVKTDNISYPAMYDTVISVGALSIEGGAVSKAGFSMDNSKVNVWAHGHRVLSTLPGNKYGFLSGTSMAAPLVTGVISAYFSKLLSENTKPTPLAAEKFIRENISMVGNTKILKLKDVIIQIN